MMDDLRALYEEVILDHNRNPRNYPRRPEGTNHSALGSNPLCGDEFTIHLKVNDEGIIEDVGFEGHGCAISTASASIMLETLKGRSVDDADELFRSVHGVLTEEAEVTAELPPKLQVLGGVRRYPMRVKCASLAWHTMQAALEGRESSVTTE